MLNLDHAGQVDEMAELAAIAHWRAQPVQHWIVSWQRGEQPTAKQADEAVLLFLEEFGLGEHQCLYALHRDTANYHIHLAINRIHPETERIVQINGGWDIEAAHRAIARIEHAQGWRRQQRGLYLVLETGELERAPIKEPVERQLTTRARDLEHRTGQKSAERVAIERAADVLLHAHDWSELHTLLSQRRMRLERRRGGAILWVGDIPVKASDVARDAGFSALERRLGPFIPPPNPQPLVSLAPETLEPASRERQEYAAERRAHFRRLKEGREGSRTRRRELWDEMLSRQREERRQILGGSWFRRGLERTALRSILAGSHANERAELRDRLRVEVEVQRSRCPPWPRFERWLHDRGRRDLAEAWRFGDKTPARVVGATNDVAPAREFSDFRAATHGRQVVYSRVGEFGLSLSFSDRGREILVHDRSSESVRGALELAARKWRSFQVLGSNEYIRLCAELAIDHGFAITNPEVQVEISRSARPLRFGMLPPQTVDPAAGQTRRAPVRDIAEAYKRHREDVRNDPAHRDIDPSRQDALIAVRLRSTGYDRAQIREVIRREVARSRAHEGRNWDEYARRVVEHSFGLSAARQLREAEHQRARLLDLEGRAPTRELRSPLGRRLDFDRGR
jgi:hypothetical protein